MSFKCCHTVCRDCAEAILLAGNEASASKCTVCTKPIEKFSPQAGGEPVDYVLNVGLAEFAVCYRPKHLFFWGLPSSPAPSPL